MILLFDAANTLIHKPLVYDAFIKTLQQNGIIVDITDLKRNHKLVSELYLFPDRTSKDFYYKFNNELLYSLGIIATNELLDNLFKACSYLPWQTFDDVSALKGIPVKKAVLSNFHNELDGIINTHFQDIFETVIISETIGLRKPDVNFYKKAIELLGVNSSEIIYVGDSIKLDIVPAREVGMNAYLIDRENYYPLFDKRIGSLTDIENIL
jgi:putative hydrolase of the HAD superfamily